MATGLSAALATRLEKVAVDNGFDRELQRNADWLSFGSTQAPLRIWLTAVGDARCLVAFSQANVARAVGSELGASRDGFNPPGAQGTVGTSDIPELHRVVRRAFQLSRSLPDELLHIFEKRAAALPRTTEAERLVVQRIGQEVFREGLIEYWDGRCAISGLAVVPLLRASHIKPWAVCASDAERLDVFNGILLAPHLDAIFDQGLATVSDDGAFLLSNLLSDHDRRILGIMSPLRLSRIDDGHLPYLRFHRENVFRHS